MRKKRALVVAVCLMLLLTVFFMGCQTDATDTTANDADDQAVSDDSGSTDAASDDASEVSLEGKKVVVMLKNLTNPFWVDVQNGCLQAGEDLGVEVEVIAPITADSNEEQIQLIEQKILEEPDIFVVAPCNSQGIFSAIEAINESGIPVINFNTYIENEDESLDLVTFVAFDHYDVGYACGEALAEAMNSEGNVIVLEGVPGQQNTIERANGGTDALEAAGIAVLESQTANWKREEGMTVTQNLLQKYDNIDGIFALNAEMAIGAAEAVNQAGLQGKIDIGCVDAFQEIIEAIQDGRVSLTVDTISFNQGYVAVSTAVDVLLGKDVPAFVGTEYKVVDSSNAGEYTFD